jgi:radical SAM protein with 4Fe4S-binding SPASM domain
MFYPQHFFPLTDNAEAETLFARAVQTIELSISSYCNRRCPYCPNAQVDRLSTNHFMADGLFLNVMRQLCRIDYAGYFHINRYNEPLADRDYALRRLREINSFIPRATVVVFTNGDYLDAAYVAALADAGVNAMLATVHEAPRGTSFADLLRDQDRRLARLGLPYVYDMNASGNVRTAHVQTGSGMSLEYVAQDFHRRDENGVLWMQDRGQSLPVRRGMVRSTPCFMPFVQMQIEWDGELLPCCQIQPDAFAKGQYTLGRLDDASNIFLEWANRNYVQWRRDLFSYAIKKAPCASCSYGGLAVDTAAMRDSVAHWRTVLEIDPPGIIASGGRGVSPPCTP